MEQTWLEITINTAADDLEDLAARLTANGLVGLVIEDEQDFKKFLEENRQYWDYVDDALLKGMEGAARVKFYVTDDAVGRAQLRQYTQGLEGYELLSAPLKENDWATSWQKYYKPLAVGERLYIVPQWERTRPIPEGKTPVWLNPGLTFGTGSHASTQLCLEGLEQTVRPGDRVLDLGCGSGILSIAALCLGARYAAAVDIDPKAVDVAYENAALNGIGRDRYLVRAGNVLTDRGLVDQLAQERSQIVLANIVADVIIPLSAFVDKFLAPGGAFLCSGIIDARAQEVRSALEQNGLTVVEKKEKTGWCAFLCRRK
jgi:ribosomal protein L11 methyltransferase